MGRKKGLGNFHGVAIKNDPNHAYVKEKQLFSSIEGQNDALKLFRYYVREGNQDRGIDLQLYPLSL